MVKLGIPIFQWFSNTEPVPKLQYDDFEGFLQRKNKFSTYLNPRSRKIRNLEFDVNRRFSFIEISLDWWQTEVGSHQVLFAAREGFDVPDDRVLLGCVLERKMPVNIKPYVWWTGVLVSHFFLPTLQWPMVVLNLGALASDGTGITISTLLAVDRRLNCDLAFCAKKFEKVNLLLRLLEYDYVKPWSYTRRANEHDVL